MSANAMNASDASANVANGLLAIDVGSSRVKLGWFPPLGECTSEHEPTLFPIAAAKLPQPEATLAVAHGGAVELEEEIRGWLEEVGATKSRRFLGSVHPVAAAKVADIFRGELRTLSCEDLPIEIRVEQPERVGIDRLLNAVAVNRLRNPQRPAIVVDLGTACTVDLISADGAFEGGAILPGTTLSSSALHSGTAALPLLLTEDFDKPPAAVGKSTRQALTAGLYWGLLGAVRELTERVTRDCPTPPPSFSSPAEKRRDLSRTSQTQLTPLATSPT